MPRPISLKKCFSLRNTVCISDPYCIYLKKKKFNSYIWVKIEIESSPTGSFWNWVTFINIFIHIYGTIINNRVVNWYDPIIPYLHSWQHAEAATSDTQNTFKTSKDVLFFFDKIHVLKSNPDEMCTQINIVFTMYTTLL